MTEPEYVITEKLRDETIDVIVRNIPGDMGSDPGAVSVVSALRAAPPMQASEVRGVVKAFSSLFDVLDDDGERCECDADDYPGNPDKGQIHVCVYCEARKAIVTLKGHAVSTAQEARGMDFESWKSSMFGTGYSQTWWDGAMRGWKEALAHLQQAPQGVGKKEL